MKFTPIGDRVLLKIEEQLTKTAGGIYIPDNASKEKPQTAKVVAIGSEVKDVKVGEKVIFSKYADSADVKIDDVEYLVMKTKEILGKF
ncbi:MAG: co-chaperone GroES [Campylobacteraceae bacterium 4484_166]|nr:MAG: co-chaperone GroES [Campylobacteraceae bacterium 4484_166]